MSEYLEDGTFDWSLGQDAWKYPNAIQDNQYAAGVNVSQRGSVLGPRNGVHKVITTFEEKTITTKYGKVRTIDSVWRAGKMQAYIPYVSGLDGYIVTVVCGLIFRTNISSGLTVLLSEDILVNQFASRINWSYAADKIILSDYPDFSVVIDGETVFRCSFDHTIGGSPAPQIPICNLTAYNQNRLFVASGTEFTAGDAVGNLATPEAPITFTEVFLPNSSFKDQFFSLPVDESIYDITAMGFIQELDTNTGIGMLFVATQKKFYYYRTNQPREQWTAGQFGGVLLANAGVAGPRSFVNVNSDLIFLSSDGHLYALSTSRNESKRWSNVPISREVENYLKFNDISLSRFATLGYFDNRIFVAANPYRVQVLTRDEEPITDYAHGGFVVLDIESMASFLSQGTPVWDGLWTGVNPIDICNVNDRCFILSKDGGNGLGENAIYELKPKTTFDSLDGRRRRIRSIVYTKQYDSKQPFVQKRESTLLVNLQNLAGDVDLKIERKPSHASNFLKSVEWHHEAPVSFVDEMPTDKFLNGVAEQQLKQIIFGDSIEEGCNPITQDEYSTYRAVQYRLTIEGENWLLDNFKTRAEVVPFLERQEEDVCSKLPRVRIPLELEPDWTVPEETVCR